MAGEIEEIKKKLDIVEVIGHYLTLKKRGRHYLTCCPFHQEKTPSFIISPELQIFKCFGCGKSGDIFTFVQEYERLDFKDALIDLAKLAGVTLTHSQQLTDSEFKKKRLLDLNREVAKFYHYILTSHPLGKSALDYLTNRKITPLTARLFQIGFSPHDPRHLTQYLSKKGFKAGELIATGTFGHSQYHQDQLYDRFQGRLTFPLCDFRGQVLGFSGRLLPGSPQNLAKYINSPETDLYHKSHTLFGFNHTREAVKIQKSVVVVEGEFDLITPYQAGFKNFVAIKGTAFTPDQLQLLRRYTDTLILGLDSDFAGSNAAKKSIELADSLEFDIQVLTLGNKYKDPDEAILADPAFFAQNLAHPIPIWDFLISSAVKNFGVDTNKGKKQVLDMVLPFLVKISNQVIRSDYYHRLAAELGSDVDAVIAQASKSSVALAKETSSATPTPLSQTKSALQTTKTDKLEEYLLAHIFSAQKPHLLAKRVAPTYHFSTPKFIQIFDHLLTVRSFSPSAFTTTLSPELHQIYQDLFLTGSTLHLEPLRRRLEIKKIIAQINILDIKLQLTDLSQKIAQAEARDNEIGLKELELQYNRLLSQLSKNSTKP